MSEARYPTLQSSEQLTELSCESHAFTLAAKSIADERKTSRMHIGTTAWKATTQVMQCNLAYAFELKLKWLYVQSNGEMLPKQTHKLAELFSAMSGEVQDALNALFSRTRQRFGTAAIAIILKTSPTQPSLPETRPKEMQNFQDFAEFLDNTIRLHDSRYKFETYDSREWNWYINDPGFLFELLNNLTQHIDEIGAA